MKRKILVRDGLEFIILETPLSVDIFSPTFPTIAPVCVFKPNLHAPAKVNWIACGEATPDVAREMASALQVGVDIAISLNRGLHN